MQCVFLVIFLFRFCSIVIAKLFEFIAVIYILNSRYTLSLGGLNYTSIRNFWRLLNLLTIGL